MSQISRDFRQRNQSRRPKVFGCAVAIAVVSVLVVQAVTSVREANKRSHAELERSRQKWRLVTVESVRNGRTQAGVSDVLLLEMLANDPQCVDTITSVWFHMADLVDPRFGRLREFKNAKEIGFYDCENADNIIDIAKEMDTVESLYFEVTRISPQSRQNLAQFRNLKKVHFEQIVDDGVIDELNKLLPNVNVEAPYPASKEPSIR